MGLGAWIGSWLWAWGLDWGLWIWLDWTLGLRPGTLGLGPCDLQKCQSFNNYIKCFEEQANHGVGILACYVLNMSIFPRFPHAFFNMGFGVVNVVKWDMLFAMVSLAFLLLSKGAMGWFVANLTGDAPCPWEGVGGEYPSPQD